MKKKKNRVKKRDQTDIDERKSRWQANLLLCNLVPTSLLFIIHSVMFAQSLLKNFFSLLSFCDFILCNFLIIKLPAFKGLRNELLRPPIFQFTL